MKTLSKLASLCLMGIALSAITACDDSTGPFGSSNIPLADRQTAEQALYPVTTQSILADSVLATSGKGVLGQVIDPETQVLTTASFLAQYAISESFSLPHRDNLVSYGSAEQFTDSIIAQLQFTTYYGDSLRPMRLGVYLLDTKNVLQEDKKYYSNLDVAPFLLSGAEASHTATTFTVKDLTLARQQSKSIRVALPNALGDYIIKQYYQHPEYFANSYQFVRHVFPGLYFKIEEGIGVMVDIDVSTLDLYLKHKIKTASGQDSIVPIVTRMAATQEVLQNTQVSNQGLESLVTNTDYTMLKSPAGIFTEVTLPIDNIYQHHESDIVNSAKISFLALQQESVASSFALPYPQEILMIRKDDMHTFFEKEEIADGRTTYIAQYLPTTNAYTFDNIATLINKIREERDKDSDIKKTDSPSVKAAKYQQYDAQHPNWDKVILVPVKTTTTVTSNAYGQQSSTLLRVYNALSLNSVRLVRGDGLKGKVEITVIYSKFPH